MIYFFQLNSVNSFNMCHSGKMVSDKLQVSCTYSNPYPLHLNRVLQHEVTRSTTTPLGWDVCPSQGYTLGILFTDIHLYIWVKRHNEEQSSLPKGRFIWYNFVSCDMLTTNLGHELFCVNQTYNLFSMFMYDTKCCGLLKHVLKPLQLS